MAEKDAKAQKGSGFFKNFMGIIISSIVSIVVTVIILVFVMNFLGKEDKKNESDTQVQQEQQINTDKPNRELGPIYALDNLLVNIQGPKKVHYLKFSIALEAENQEVLNEITTRDVQVRDIVNSSFASLSYDEAANLYKPDENGITGKEKIEVKILEKINDVLSKGKIVAVYIKQFLIQ